MMSENDSFWSLDEFAPKKTVMRPKDRDIEAVEITFEGEDGIISSAREVTSEGVSSERIKMRPDTTLTERMITAIPQKPTPSAVPDVEYDSELRFIGRVKLFFKKDYNYYVSFLSDGQRLFGETGADSPYVSYFSYVPQYSQLTVQQLDCYLNLRRLIRQGDAPRAEYSYILLYISELINVDPDVQSVPEKLAALWQSYRHTYPKLDSFLPEWITDYCLLTRSMPPRALPRELWDFIFSHAALRELFFSGKDEDVKRLVASGAFSAYDYKKSKFATSENLPIYERIIPSVVARVLRHLGSEGKLRYGTGRLSRDMFTGLLCTPQRKCRVEVDYISLSRSHEVRFVITDAIKHAENKIRGYLGIKSRLTVYSLPVDLRKMIDEFIFDQLGSERQPKKEEETEYSHLYEIPKHEFSIEEAKRIEESSWQTTELLVESFDSESDSSSLKPVSAAFEHVTGISSDPMAGGLAPVTKEDIAASSGKEPCRVSSAPMPIRISDDLSSDIEVGDASELVSALDKYMDFIRAARDCDIRTQRSIAENMGLLVSSVADRINGISADILGDILLEEGPSGYKIIEDYAEDFKNV